LEQAIQVARREGGSLRGLHVTADPAQQESEQARSIQERFARRCQEANVPGKLVLETGKTARIICDRSRWAALVVVNLAHPPGDTPLARLGSNFRTLLLRCARPVLAVPQVRPLDSVLMAFDGSPKAWEGLFVAAYLAGRWGIPLTVLTVQENGPGQGEIADQAKRYLQSRGVQATHIEETGSVAQAILGTAADQDRDLIIMGGYGRSPVVEAFLGSAVDQVLRESDRPVLICR
jgi:nucleotide-binding universal stress UspA family protein